jgi:Ca-activated chloride channel family protein
MAGQETAIGDALGLAVKKLRERPEGSRIIILLTDGDNNAGNLIPLQAAQLAKQYNIRIYTIGVGEQGGGFRRGLNERPLSEIAQLTGGIYFSAEDLSALKQVYDHIDQTLQKTEAESRIYMQRTPLYQWPLGIAMLALLGLPILRWYFGELA